jgi:hypothetical protein
MANKLNAELEAANAISRPGMFSLKALAKQLYCRTQGMVPRSEQPFATHIPVLIGVAAVCFPHRLIEFGSGNFSTLTFLDERIFPSLNQIESYENDLSWMQEMETKVAGDSRVTCRFFEGKMRDAVSQAGVAAADLIFIDDSANGWERAHTVTEVARTCREKPITIVHDYDLPAIRFACRKFDYRFPFTAFTPQSCAVWNGNPGRRAWLEGVERRITENASRLPAADAQGWAKVFHG